MIRTDDSRCVGCAACADACAQGAISMVPDAEGFLRPVVDRAACVDCGVCEAVCQIPTDGQSRGATGGNDGASLTINTPLRYFGAVSREAEVTASSSSGGVFFLLARRVIEKGGIVYGAAYGDDLQVRHIRVDGLDGLHKLQGSKYIQSDTRGVFPQVLEDLRTGRKVLFSGTPCQVAALKLFLGEAAVADSSEVADGGSGSGAAGGLLTVDFICHGVPSPGLWKDYLAFAHEQTGQQIMAVTLRDKRKVTDRFHSCLKLGGGKEIYDRAIANLWIKIFLSSMAMRPSCHGCAFASPQRVSDITLADFWGGEQAHKVLFDLGRGVSLVMCGTANGEKAVAAVLPQMVWEEASAEDIQQPRLHSPAAPSPRRAAFWADRQALGFGRELAGKYLDYGALNIIRRRLRAALGLKKR